LVQIQASKQSNKASGWVGAREYNLLLGSKDSQARPGKPGGVGYGYGYEKRGREEQQAVYHR
jgi:hypothetical protein